MTRKLNDCLEYLLCLMHDYAYLKDKEGIYLNCSDSYAKIAGLSSRNEIVGKTDHDLPWKIQANVIRRTDLEALKNRNNLTTEETLTLADGTTSHFLTTKSILINKNGEIIGIFATLSDIFDKKKQQTNIALENILNNVPAHIFWKDRNCILMGCNDLQAKHMGYSFGNELVGKSNYDVIWPDQPEEDKKSQAEEITRADLEVINTGKTSTVEEPLVLPDGSTAIYLSKKTPLRNDKNEIVGLLGIAFDVTEQKKMEQELAETKHKLEGMTLVSTAIAHELRTPLAAFGISTNNIQQIFPYLRKAYLWAKEKGEEKLQDIDPSYLDDIEEALSSMEKEIKSAFTFIEISLMNTNPSLSVGKSEIFSIKDVVNEALTRYPFDLGQKELIKWKNNHEIDFMIAGEKLLIVHVLFNLMKNALYYISKAGKGDIQIWLEMGSNYNKLFFKDTGAGISSEILPHIFDQFFSKTYHGAGIGLSFCKSVIESLGGKITCESAEGDYTLFVLAFPANI